ncbi:MAG: hypothetical protein WA902_20530 [Thermosynechococcaceae cyanobacterium]
MRYRSSNKHLEEVEIALNSEEVLPLLNITVLLKVMINRRGFLSVELLN